MVNSASPAATDTREATEDVWRHAPVRAEDLEPNIPVARGVSDGLVTDVEHVNEDNDGLSSEVAVLLKPDIDLHLRHGRRGGE